MLEILTSPFMIRAIIAAVFVSIISSLVGNHTLYRKGTFLLVSVAHSSFAGAALAIFLTIEIRIYLSPYLGALILGLSLTLPLCFGKRTLSNTFEITSGVVFATSMSLVVLFLSLLREQVVEVWGLLVGNILLLTRNDLITLATLSLVVIAIIVLINRTLIYTAFDPEGSESLGLSPRLYNVIFVILLTISTIVLIKTIGIFLVYVIMILPPLISHEFTEQIRRQFILSFIFSFLSLIFGLILAIFINASPSAIAGIILTVVYPALYFYHARK